MLNKAASAHKTAVLTGAGVAVGFAAFGPLALLAAPKVLGVASLLKVAGAAGLGSAAGEAPSGFLSSQCKTSLASQFY